MEKETSIFDRDEIVHYLETAEVERELFKKADKVRKDCCGDEVHIRGIIEFSNYCSKNCLYCGLRRANRKVQRYRIKKEEVVDLALKIASLGIRTVVLQSGDDLCYPRESICEIISEIKKNVDIAITLSMGERPFEDYKAFKEAGADRYLLKQETANFSLYERLHPGQNLTERLKILEYLKKLGYQIGAGNIVGLPGQTLKNLADDILLLRELDADMAGIGPFIPQKDTPLKNSPPGGLSLTLRVLALARILTRNSHLPVTTALATLDPREGQLLGFKSGCNVIMPDFTPEPYRKNYVIYDHKIRVDLERAKALISEAGRKISPDKGDSLKCKRPQKVSVCR